MNLHRFATLNVLLPDAGYMLFPTEARSAHTHAHVDNIDARIIIIIRAIFRRDPIRKAFVSSTIIFGVKIHIKSVYTCECASHTITFFCNLLISAVAHHLTYTEVANLFKQLYKYYKD